MKKANHKGFSLVELMVVVGIIGVLAALAVPRFQNFQARAKSSEGRTSMSAIHTLETAYHADNDTYGGLGDIGFVINGLSAGAGTTATISANTSAKVRFTYSTPSANTTTFTGRAVAAAGALGGCQTGAYTVDINQDKVFSNATSIPGC